MTLNSQPVQTATSRLCGRCSTVAAHTWQRSPNGSALCARCLIGATDRSIDRYDRLIDSLAGVRVLSQHLA